MNSAPEHYNFRKMQLLLLEVCKRQRTKGDETKGEGKCRSHSPGPAMMVKGSQWVGTGAQRCSCQMQTRVSLPCGARWLLLGRWATLTRHDPGGAQAHPRRSWTWQTILTALRDLECQPRCTDASRPELSPPAPWRLLKGRVTSEGCSTQRWGLRLTSSQSRNSP